MLNQVWSSSSKLSNGQLQSQTTIYLPTWLIRCTTIIHARNGSLSTIIFNMTLKQRCKMQHITQMHSWLKKTKLRRLDNCQPYTKKMPHTSDVLWVIFKRSDC